MNTNDAKEYLARREIPQLFEVRDVCAPFCEKSLVIFLSFFQNIYLPKRVSLGKTGVHVASH